MRNYLKYDDTQVLKYDSIILAVIYTIGHILIAMACNRIITGATLDMAAADAFVEPIINGFWFYFLLVYIKTNIERKINDNTINFISNAKLGIYLAIVYTIGHIFIAMTCNRLLTGAPLNLAAIDALVEPMVNGFWFYLLFEVFNKYKSRTKAVSGKNNNNPMVSEFKDSKLAPVNNKKNID